VADSLQELYLLHRLSTHSDILLYTKALNESCGAYKSAPHLLDIFICFAMKLSQNVLQKLQVFVSSPPPSTKRLNALSRSQIFYRKAR